MTVYTYHTQNNDLQVVWVTIMSILNNIINFESYDIFKYEYRLTLTMVLCCAMYLSLYTII